jgi:hypothetical protein
MIPMIMMTAVMEMVIMVLMIVIVIVLMLIVVRIPPSRFPAGSAVINGDPRIRLSTFLSAQDATAGSGRAMWSDGAGV